MRIDLRAFIAVETSMAASMHAEWDRLAGGIFAGLKDFIDKRDWAQAQTLANKLTLKGIVTNVRPRLEELAHSAVLFGAANVTGDVRETSIFKNKAAPPELHHALDMLEHALESDASDYIRTKLHEEIETLKRLDPQAHDVVKHDKYTEPDKRPDGQLLEQIPDAPDPDKKTLLAQEKLLGQGKWQYADLASPDAGAKAKKDGDLSEGDLAETGGLLEPEQGETAPKPRKRRRKAEPQTLYVNRPLLNGDMLRAWARGVGFASTLPINDLHVTVCFSKQAFDWSGLEPKQDNITCVGDARSIQRFGDAIVLTFDSALLAEDHQEFLDAGASHGFPDYKPHVTITYDLDDAIDVSTIAPYLGPLTFGPEKFGPIKEKWADNLTEDEIVKADRNRKRAKLFKGNYDDLFDAVANQTKMKVNIQANLTTSRLVALGFLNEAQKVAETRYQITSKLDDEVCPVCLALHGRVFSVQNEYSRLLQALNARDPEVLKTLAPWPGQDKASVNRLKTSSSATLQADGFGSPPFHPKCRCTLVKVGEAGPVKEPEDNPSPDEPAPDKPKRAKPKKPGDDLHTLTIPAEEGAPEPPNIAKPTTSVLEDIQAAIQAVTENPESLDGVRSAVGPLPESVTEWTPEAIEQLGFSRFDILDPEVQSKFTDAFDAEDYDAAHAILSEYLAANPSETKKEEISDGEGPNAPRQKRKPKQRAGLETDYDDIASDSSSIAFDSGSDVQNLNLAPLDRL